MNNKHKLLIADASLCKRLFGISFEDFNIILEKLQKRKARFLKEKPIHCRGLKSKFSFANQLLLCLEYLKQYPTFLYLGFSYGISESYAHKIYHRISELLASELGLKNPELLSYEKIKNLIVDVTVQPIERPKKEQEKYYNGSKKNIL
jgi:hypothetical protein